MIATTTTLCCIVMLATIITLRRIVVLVRREHRALQRRHDRRHHGPWRLLTGTRTSAFRCRCTEKRRTRAQLKLPLLAEPPVSTQHAR
jgi:hypothetical protein